MISAGTRPRLAAKARLRYDRKTTRYLLLYPERGLELNPTAAEILKLCDGERTVDAIVDRLAAAYPKKARDAVEREVLEFLGALAERGLVRGEADD